PKFEAESVAGSVMSPGDKGLRQARLALHFSPDLASRRETY
ncbi:hypothetical protein A2U01_0064553, partial [Trifolium medium]|nr:hypothetical protein [Trifolium medium]